MKDPYKALHISPSASPQEIKEAYYQLAHRYHPDRNPNDVHAAEMFKLINEAYSVLSKYGLPSTPTPLASAIKGNPNTVTIAHSRQIQPAYVRKSPTEYHPLIKKLLKADIAVGAVSFLLLISAGLSEMARAAGSFKSSSVLQCFVIFGAYILLSGDIRQKQWRWFLIAKILLVLQLMEAFVGVAGSKEFLSVFGPLAWQIATGLVFGLYRYSYKEREN